MFLYMNPNKDKAHVKTLGKWFNDVYNKRELYIYSKRLSLYVYKNKTNKNTADKCIKIYYVSWFTYLKLLHNRSVLCRHDWKPFFLLFLFFVVRSEQCPSVLYSTMETKTLYIRVLESQFVSDCRIRKRGNKTGTHSFRWAQASNVKCFTECVSWDTDGICTWLALSARFFLFLSVESHGHLGCELINHTRNTPKNIQKYYIFNLPRVRQFCN